MCVCGSVCTCVCGQEYADRLFSWSEGEELHQVRLLPLPQVSGCRRLIIDETNHLKTERVENKRSEETRWSQPASHASRVVVVVVIVVTSLSSIMWFLIIQKVEQQVFVQVVH